MRQVEGFSCSLSANGRILFDQIRSISSVVFCLILPIQFITKASFSLLIEFKKFHLVLSSKRSFTGTTLYPFALNQEITIWPNMPLGPKTTIVFLVFIFSSDKIIYLGIRKNYFFFSQSF